MKVRLSWILLFGLLLASWYLGWFAPFKTIFWLARWGWQALSVLQRTDPKPDDNSMIAALRNATGSDFNQLAGLLEDFFAQNKEPDVEMRLKEFVTQRARRAHPELEVTLDWILAIYKVSWPLPVLFLLSRMAMRGGGDRDDDTPASTPRHSFSAKSHHGLDSLPPTPSMRGPNTFDRLNSLTRQSSVQSMSSLGASHVHRHNSFRAFH